MKIAKKCVITFMLMTALLSAPKNLAWWNTIYSCDYVCDKNDDIKVKFFIIELLHSIRTCKKR